MYVLLGMFRFKKIQVSARYSSFDIKNIWHGIIHPILTLYKSFVVQMLIPAYTFLQYLNRKDENRMKTIDICLNYVTMLPQPTTRANRKRYRFFSSINVHIVHTYTVFFHRDNSSRTLSTRIPSLGFFLQGHAMPKIFLKIKIKFI